MTRSRNPANAIIAGVKLEGKSALITGGDSGIGRAVTVLFANEGADVAAAYLNEHRDAKETQAARGKSRGENAF